MGLNVLSDLVLEYALIHACHVASIQQMLLLFLLVTLPCQVTKLIEVNFLVIKWG